MLQKLSIMLFGISLIFPWYAYAKTMVHIHVVMEFPLMFRETNFMEAQTISYI